MATTGEKCNLTGVYRGQCPKGHVEEARFQSGDTFTPCSTGTCGGQGIGGSVRGSAMTWTWIRSS